MNAGETSSPESTATFAGGCFWCMEPPFDKLPGVLKVIPGYTGGHVPNPTYEQVCTGATGHAEAVRIHFHSTRIGYNDLLDVFWRNIDPTTKNAQFADRGSQYRTAIFYHNEQQRRLAEASRDALQALGKFGAPLVTEIVPAPAFYPAEAYHCAYYQKNPDHYRLYRTGSGREGFLRRMWGGISK